MRARVAPDQFPGRARQGRIRHKQQARLAVSRLAVDRGADAPEPERITPRRVLEIKRVRVLDLAGVQIKNLRRQFQPFQVDDLKQGRAAGGGLAHGPEPPTDQRPERAFDPAARALQSGAFQSGPGRAPFAGEHRQGRLALIQPFLGRRLPQLERPGALKLAFGQPDPGLERIQPGLGLFRGEFIIATIQFGQELAFCHDLADLGWQGFNPGADPGADDTPVQAHHRGRGRALRIERDVGQPRRAQAGRRRRDGINRQTSAEQHEERDSHGLILYVNGRDLPERRLSPRTARIVLRAGRD